MKPISVSVKEKVKEIGEDASNVYQESLAWTE